MRKLYSTAEYKKKNTLHAKRSLKGKLRLKVHKKILNRSKIGESRTERERASSKHLFFDYRRTVVPADFSFLSDPEAASSFIKDVKIHFNKKRKVFVVMRNVKMIDHSAIVILLSIMVRFKSQKIKFNGDFPENQDVATTFKNSGFFEILSQDQLKDSDRYKLGKQKIYTHAWKNIDAELSETIMKDISFAIHDEHRVYKGLHRTFIELMQNSFNHAVPFKEGDKHWWISVNVNKKLKSVSFAFIDYGVGIFESLNRKGETSKWYQWREKLLNKFSSETNADILRLILEGELHKTVTGDYFRGKGLPGIKEAMDRNLISKLHIVTNDVHANVSENIYKSLSNNFEGTFVYWEINEYTENIPWIN